MEDKESQGSAAPTDGGVTSRSNALLEHLDVRSAREALRDHGHYIRESVYAAPFCRDVIDAIDAYTPPAGKTESNYSGTELRIWDAQSVGTAFKQFFDDCNDYMSQLLGTRSEAHTLLAIRNRELPTGDKSTMGRWHLDSVRRQLKIFLFLTDTTEESGPFEFIPNTHKTTFKLRMLGTGQYVKPRDLIGGEGRAYQRLDEGRVSRLLAGRYPSRAVVCRAGTAMLVDTSTIHRARACIHGSRYALTAYFR